MTSHLGTLLLLLLHVICASVPTEGTEYYFVWNGMKLQHAVCIINVWACAEILPA